ncbi:MAG: HEPN domain-containing protein [Thermoproteota archaeon]
MATSYIKQAEERLHHASEALQREKYPYVIRQSQEAVELSLKAALRLVGIEPPKWHDVGPVLRQNSDRFPEWFKEEIPRYASISRRLRREREPSMYGDEETGLSPEEIYTKEDAEDALRSAKTIYMKCNELLEKHEQ